MFHILYGSFFWLSFRTVIGVVCISIPDYDTVIFKHIDDTGHMGYFYLLTIMMNTAVNIQVCMYVYLKFPGSSIHRLHGN